MSLGELSQQKIVSYEGFIEFLKRQFDYPLNEDIAKKFYNQYVDERKAHFSNIDTNVPFIHQTTLRHYSVMYAIELTISELRKRSSD